MGRGCHAEKFIDAKTAAANDSSCWLELTQLRKQCHQLQLCCLSSDSCMLWLLQAEAGMALRRQHQLINRKTLQCRSAVHISSATSSSKTKPATMVERKKATVAPIGSIPLSSDRLDYLEQLLRVLEQRESQQQSSPSKAPTWMARLAARAGRPSQFMADHQPRGIFPTSRRLQQERKAAAAVQQLIARRQPQSFALPSSLDLQRLRASADNFIVGKLSFLVIGCPTSIGPHIWDKGAAATPIAERNAKPFGCVGPGTEAAKAAEGICRQDGESCHRAMESKQC